MGAGAWSGGGPTGCRYIAEGRGRRIVSYCTCPIGGQCKHGVA